MLGTLKVDFEENFVRIFKLEKEIGKIRDENLRDKLKNLKIFECLNAEKASPHFLNIAKKTKSGPILEDIKKNNGEEFMNKEQREEHVIKFYSELYKKDPTVSGEIADFLGPEVCAHPLVRASRLTQGEKQELDAPLTVQEIEKSLKQVNLKSAPGIEGYSYRFITKFWYIFKIPFFNCCSYSLAEGTLPDSFRTAQIKLIPKKGDPSLIKNWRPISLLSNFYKILSRALNNRLKKVVNRVLSRSQKGFKPSRQLHEVIINALENMNFFVKNKVKGAIVSIDMSKAFD